MKSGLFIMGVVKLTTLSIKKHLKRGGLLVSYVNNYNCPAELALLC